MSTSSDSSKTIRLELNRESSLTEFARGPDEIQAEELGASTAQLARNYRSILEHQAIYYPVAFKFERELGRGRQGIVFLARRLGARGCITQHAIKVYDPTIYSSPKLYWTDMGRIADQVSRLQTIESPNLVSREIYDEVNGIGYVQMEVIQGIDLRKFLGGEHLERARARSTPREWNTLSDVMFRIRDGVIGIQPGIALYIIRQVLRGLEQLHQLGFLHSDVKPSNIMINQLGYVKIVDFGRAVRSHEHVTILFGTPLYMAPEIHHREPGTCRSDLYSLGLVAIEMLLGRRVVNYEGMSESDLLEAKRKLPGRMHKLLPDHVTRNASLMGILHKLIAVRPEDRFESASAAESSEQGVHLVHKQLTLVGQDTQYDRDLERYISKVLS